MDSRFRVPGHVPRYHPLPPPWHPSPAPAPAPAWLASHSCGDGYFPEEATWGWGERVPRTAEPPGCPSGRDWEWEAVRRERIRREVRRRVIEEEVRREFDLGMELAAQHRGFPPVPDAFMPPGPMPMPVFLRVPPPLQEFGAHEPFRRFGPTRPSVEFGCRFGRNKQILSLPLPPLRSSSPTKRKLELRKIEPSESSKASSVAPKVAGMKRKVHANTIDVADAPKRPQKPTQDWRCVLCQVSTTSEAALDEHFGGRKHKAKLVQHGISNMSDDNKNKATIGDKNCSPPDDTPNNINILVDGVFHAIIQKNNYLWCEHCAFRCVSNITMTDHLQGKKHSELTKEDLAVGVDAQNKEDLAVVGDNKVSDNVRVDIAKEVKNEQGGGDLSVNVASHTMNQELNKKNSSTFNIEHNQDSAAAVDIEE